MMDILKTKLTVLLLGLSTSQAATLSALLKNQELTLLMAETADNFFSNHSSIPDIILFPSSFTCPQLVKFYEQERQDRKSAPPYLICTIEDNNCLESLPGFQEADDLLFLHASLPAECLQIRLQAIVKNVARSIMLSARQFDAPVESEALVHERTETLARFIEHLKDEMQQRQQAEEMLRRQSRIRKKMLLELQDKNQEIQEANIGLRVLLDQHKRTREEVEGRITETLQSVVIPYVELLRQELKNRELAGFYLDILSSNLEAVLSSFTIKLRSSHLGLTSREIQVADLVRQGYGNKEIGNLLHLTPGTIESYRNSLRKKLGLRGKKVNLRTFLLSTFVAESTGELDIPYKDVQGCHACAPLRQ